VSREGHGHIVRWSWFDFKEKAKKKTDETRAPSLTTSGLVLSDRVPSTPAPGPWFT
jgi:hypothetical protein